MEAARAPRSRRRHPTLWRYTKRRSIDLYRGRKSARCGSTIQGAASARACFGQWWERGRARPVEWLSARIFRMKGTGGSSLGQGSPLGPAWAHWDSYPRLIEASISASSLVFAITGAVHRRKGKITVLLLE